VWRVFTSWLLDGLRQRPHTVESCSLPNRSGAHGSARTPVIALTASQHDREILMAVSCRGLWDVHFADSRVQAWEIVHRFGSPVVLYDRDWPNAEWRTTVHTFASCPQRPCVILMSRVADDYLWQELIRCGGHDLLAKPLRPDDVNRALKLAWSYWNSLRAAASP
jgi:CheY-like chemotaxis protein